MGSNRRQKETVGSLLVRFSARSAHVTITRQHSCSFDTMIGPGDFIGGKMASLVQRLSMF